MLISLVDAFLSDSQQQLYVRLFLRKHDWFRENKVVYKDIASDLAPVIHSLVDKGFLLDGKIFKLVCCIGHIVTFVSLES